MLKFDQGLVHETRELILAFDAEWTKNFRLKNANKPFCFSYVYMPASAALRSPNGVRFGLKARYVQSPAEIPALVAESERILRGFFKQTDSIVFVGHQVTSDLAALLNYDGQLAVPCMQGVRQAWHERKAAPKRIGGSILSVFDTRYDLDALLRRKSRRLVDVCQEFRLDVTQPELAGASMTALQNRCYETGDPEVRERLLILNIRHSLSALLLCLLGRSARRRPSSRKARINVNQVLRNNLSEHFGYLRSEAFKKLL